MKNKLLATLSVTFSSIFLLILSFPNFILAKELKGLVEENFGERYYGVYIEDYKLGYVVNKLSQNKDEVVADFSMNLRLPAKLAKAEVEGAKYTLSQTITQHKFEKKTDFFKKELEFEEKYRSKPTVYRKSKWSTLSIGTTFMRYLSK